jgi:Spy/CpxP family protein refolding chaperone
MRFAAAILTLLLLSFSLVPPLSAQNSYREFERGLNLTESQRRRAEEVREKYIQEWRFQRQEALRRRLELNDLRRNPAANRDRIEKSQRELRDIDRSWERSYNQYRSDLAQVLNERQRNQYNQFSEWERRNRAMPPQGFRGPEVHRQGQMVREGFRGPAIQRHAPMGPGGFAVPGARQQGPIVREGFRGPSIQGQGRMVPDKRGFPPRGQTQRGREMGGYGR